MNASAERISADRRHADVMVLSFTPAERRSFPEWPMGFRGQTEGQGADLLADLLADPALAAFASVSPRTTTASDVLRLLEKVVQREDEWIAA